MKEKFQIGTCVQFHALSGVFVVKTVTEGGCTLVHLNSITGYFVDFVDAKFIVPFDSLIIRR